MGIMDLIGWVVFGLVAGAIARFLHPGKDPMNWLWTMLLGIGGAVLGGFLVRLIGIEANEGIASWIAAIGGSILLLIAYHFLTARRGPAAVSGTATNEEYKRAVFDDLAHGPKG